MPAPLLLSLTAAASLLTAAAPEPCRLLTPAEVRASLGAAPTAISPDGPNQDPDLKANSWTCTQEVGQNLLELTVVEFDSASAAAGGMVTMMQVTRGSLDAMNLSPAAGVGDRSAWGTSDSGGMWVAIKGRYLISLSYGMQTATPATQRESLRQLATLALSRLQ
jgi:hypothetical protein